MELVFATSFLDRAIGMLKKRPANCVLVLMPCNSIHTYFMRERIDIAFVDKRGRVLFSEREVKPNRILRSRYSFAVLERISDKDKSWVSSGEQVEISIKSF